MSNPKTPWQKGFDPNYMGSWSLEENEIYAATVTKAVLVDVTNPDGKTHPRIVIHFDVAPRNGILLPMIIGNKANAKKMEEISGSKYIEDWVGKFVEVYVLGGIKAFGTTTEALRIRKPAKSKELAALQAECRAQLASYPGADKAEIVAKLKAKPNDKETLDAAIKKMKAV
jgi:hypothetical protein